MAETSKRARVSGGDEVSEREQRVRAALAEEGK